MARTHDDKIYTKIPAAEKRELEIFAEKLGLTVSQVVREAIQWFRPKLIKRVEQKEKATAVVG